jgi:hypothetical protein
MAPSYEFSLRAPFRLRAGNTGQTTEVLALPAEGEPFERVVGVYIPSYATASFSYHFRRQAQR